MALTANRDVNRYVDQQIRQYEVEANKRIFKGAFVGASASGHAQPLVAGDTFLGVAYEESDNTGGSDGDKKVRVFTQGDFAHALSGATKADVGAPVYASDDGTLTLTATANSFVGFIVDVPSSGNVIARLDVFRTAP